MFTSIILAFAAPANAAETVVFGHDTQITIVHRAFGVLEGGSTLGLAPVATSGTYLLVSEPILTPDSDGVFGHGWISVFSPEAGESVTVLIDDYSSMEDIAEALELSGMGLTVRVMPATGGYRLAVALDEDGETLLDTSSSLGPVTPIDAPTLGAFGLYQDTGALHLQALGTSGLSDWGKATFQGSGWLVPADIGSLNLLGTSWSQFGRVGYLFLGDTEWVWSDVYDDQHFNESGWDVFDESGAVY